MMNYHNVNGPVPTLTELVRFLHHRETHVEMRRGALPDTVMALAYAYTPRRDQALLTDLIASGWAFQHMDMISSRRKGEFHILVRLV